MKLFLFFLLSLCVSIQAKNLYINARTGELIPEENMDGATTYGSWPISNPLGVICTPYVDAFLIAYKSKYEILDWYFDEVSYGEKGSLGRLFSIYDLQNFTSFASENGVWDRPQDCNAIWTQMEYYVIKETLQQLGHQEGRPDMVARYNGLKIEMQCKIGSQLEYHVCSKDELFYLLQISPSQNMRVFS
jgi:hypothetical protein